MTIWQGGNWFKLNPLIFTGIKQAWNQYAHFFKIRQIQKDFLKTRFKRSMLYRQNAAIGTDLNLFFWDNHSIQYKESCWRIIVFFWRIFEDISILYV